MTTTGRLYYDLCSTALGHSLTRQAFAALRRLGFCLSYRLPIDCLALPHDAVRTLMQLWKRIHWSGGDGMMPPEQMLAIFQLAAQAPGNSDIVELGAWTGLTTCYLASACRLRGSARVHAVDTFAGTKENGETYASITHYNGSTESAFHNRIRAAGIEDRVVALKGYTCDMVHLYEGSPIGMLFIDADHSYEGVSQDFELWSPLVMPGGLVVFHDYNMAGVARFVDEDMPQQEGFARTPGNLVDNVVAFTKTAKVTRSQQFERPNVEAACA